MYILFTYIHADRQARPYVCTSACIHIYCTHVDMFAYWQTCMNVHASMDVCMLYESIHLGMYRGRHT